MHYSTTYEKIEIKHLSKVIGALQSPKDILLNAYVSKGHLKVEFF